jgi:Zn-dependent protease with chaperone function
VQQALSSSTESATAKDRSITVVVGAQGEVTAIRFHTERYREMAADELSAALVDLISRARTRMSERVAAAFAPLAGVGEALRSSMVGGTELDGLLDRMRAAGAPARRDPAEEEFDG